MHKQLPDSRPLGIRRPGRPLKRPLNGYKPEAETCNVLVTRRRRRRRYLCWWASFQIDWILVYRMALF